MNKVEQTFWMVWGTRARNSPPVMKHVTLKGAQMEAERLAQTVPGVTFVVLQAVQEITATVAYNMTRKDYLL